ncbi:MAG: Nif3-like dinuclear metal center hexameric protein [Marinifilaceae bacterium]
MKLSLITSLIEDFSPISLQESYDNAGLLTGNDDMEISSALLCLDITEEVIEEAIEAGNNLIISHHPLVFKGLKKFNGSNMVERCLIKAIKNDIAIYSAHTNIDSVINGVSAKMSEKLNLKNTKILAPTKGNLKKLICYCPKEQSDKVREAIFSAGAGEIGNYSNCSYNIEGKGSFKANEKANPFVGKIGDIHFEEEIRIETIVAEHRLQQTISAMTDAHPYEEVAYDIMQTENINPNIGFGMIGELEEAMDTKEFLQSLKTIFDCTHFKHSKIVKEQIKSVALCGGSGSFLINKALSKKADIYITGDIKYHDYFTTEDKIILADIGHYESEQFTKEIFYELVTKKLPTFAVRFSKVNTNPINYI